MAIIYMTTSKTTFIFYHKSSKRSPEELIHSRTVIPKVLLESNLDNSPILENL